jgi:serine/threonine-protein kinase
MKLSEEQWLELSRLLDEALALAPDERHAWLATLTDAPGVLRTTLGELLSRDATAETDAFLSTLPKLHRVRHADPAPSRLAEGVIVGPYRLLREVGKGGMGSVWLAERTDGMVKRPVALKLPHETAPGAHLEERFARERDILAALSHPHIARLYDAGVTDDGQPYLALEYVDGQPLGNYCDSHRLNLARRLALFLQMLEAVQYAHARLVVHRDLKPSNVLVDADGQVHLLDFGIAKLLAEGRAIDSDLTQAAGHLLTPHYASPEQVSGATVTTATDIYSLGVILYELITGERPYRLKRESRGALEEAILEADVLRPSVACKEPAKAALRASSPGKLQRTLRGDLDTIILKALKKIPAERYPSVTAFSDDLGRFLGHEPVSARPDSLGYRAAKFVRRNRVGVALSGLAVFALMAGLAGTITQAERAKRAAAVAEQQRNRADEQARAASEQRDFALRQLSRATAVNDLNQFLLSDAAPSGKPFTAGELLARAEAIIERQQGQDANRTEMLVSIGRQYGTMDEDDKALRLSNQAYQMSRQLTDHSARSRAACALALAINRGGDRERAEALFREGVVELPIEPQFVLDRVSCFLDGSTMAREGNDFPLGLERAKEAEALLAQLREPSPVLEMRVTMELAEAYRQTGQFPSAVHTFERVYSQLVALGRENTETAGTLYNNWGLALYLMGQPREAEQLLRRAMGVSSADGTDKHVSPMVLTNLARTQLVLEKNAEAAHNAERAYVRARAAGDEAIITQSLVVRAACYRKLGDYARAERVLDEVEPRLKRMGGLLGQARLASERSLLAKARGHPAIALADMDEAVAAAEQSRSPDGFRYFVLLRAELDLAVERFGAALDDSRKAIQLYVGASDLDTPSGNLGRAYLVEGRALIASGRGDEAEQAFTLALVQLRPSFGADHPLTKLAARLESKATHRIAPAR